MARQNWWAASDQKTATFIEKNDKNPADALSNYDAMADLHILKGKPYGKADVCVWGGGAVGAPCLHLKKTFSPTILTPQRTNQPRPWLLSPRQWVASAALRLLLSAPFGRHIFFDGFVSYRINW